MWAVIQEIEKSKLQVYWIENLEIFGIHKISIQENCKNARVTKSFAMNLPGRISASNVSNENRWKLMVHEDLCMKLFSNLNGNFYILWELDVGKQWYECGWMLMAMKMETHELQWKA